MSETGYNFPSEPPPRHVCNGPSFGHSNGDVRIRADFFRYALSFGRSRLPQYTGSYDPKETFLAPTNINTPFTMMRYDGEIAVGLRYSRSEAFEQLAPY